MAIRRVKLSKKEQKTFTPAGQSAQSWGYPGYYAAREREAREQKVYALARVLDGVVRTLARPIQPKLRVLVTGADKPQSPVPAWTDLESIWIDGFQALEQQKKSPTLARWISGMKGLVFHELAHVFYSPDKSGSLGNKVHQQGYDMAWNLLEDQRIETLMGGELPPIRAYFRTMLCDILVDNENLVDRKGEALATWWAFLCGRRYVGADLLAEVKAAATYHMGPQWVSDVEATVLAYGKVIFPADQGDAFDLIKRMHELLNKLPNRGLRDTWIDVVVKTGPPTSDGADNKANARGRTPEPKVQEKAKEAVEGQARAAASKPKNDEETGQGGAATGRASEKDEADQLGQAGSGAGEGGDEPGQGEGDGGTEGSGGQGAGTALGDNQKDHKYAGPESLKKALKAEATDARTDANLVRGADAMAKAYAKVQEQPRPFDPKKLGDQSNYTTTNVSAEARAVAKRITTAVQKARTDLEPVWNRHQKAGRLNTRREIMARPEDLDVFDKFYPGEIDATAAEVVLLLDNSGSMDRYERELTDAAWAVSRGLEALDIPTTIIAFNSYTDLLKQRHQRVNRQQAHFISSRGGTMATGACTAARSVLAEAKAPVKILLVLTDGGWGDSKASEEAIGLMNVDGVQTVILGLAGAVDSYGTHGCRVGKDISSPKEIPNVIEKALLDAVDGVKHRVALEHN